MSFQNKSFWIPRDADCLTEGEMGYGPSARIEPKRAHQWFMDASEPELFCNKKQAIDAVNSRPMSGISNVNSSLWENTSSFQSVSGPFTDRLFGPEPLRSFNLAGRNISSVGTGSLNMERKGFEDHFGNDSLVSLSMSHAVEDPSSCLSYGVRKVKVNQVRDSDNAMSVSMGHPYNREENNASSMGTAYKTDGGISLGATYNNANGSIISIGSTFDKADENFVSVGHTFNKGDGNFILMGHNYSNGDDSILSMSQPFDRGDGNFISMDQRYGKGDGNIISVGPPYNKEHENFISMGPTYNKPNEKFISVGATYDKGDGHIISVGSTHDKEETNVVSTGTTNNKGNSNILSMGQNNNKGEGTTISFGGFQDESEANNPSGRIISSYDMVMSQTSDQASKATGWKDSVECNPDPIVSVTPAATSRIDTIPKNKGQKTAKKVPPNNFPSNVKSLLSTGILDGVPVKYVSWSREKNLQGVINGTGYLCGCNDCKLSKALNAYEFERHAGCKTKHPNNHIYFENGKTIYAIVQELKSTPQDLLFEAIQNVTGSSINQKNFRIWKASYQAATRELQRIYGKEEVIMPS